MKNKITLNLTKHEVDILTMTLGLANNNLHHLLGRSYTKGDHKDIINKNIEELKILNNKIINEISITKLKEYIKNDMDITLDLVESITKEGDK